MTPLEQAQQRESDLLEELAALAATQRQAAECTVKVVADLAIARKDVEIARMRAELAGD